METRLAKMEAKIEGHDIELRDIKKNHKDEVNDIKDAVSSLQSSVGDIRDLIKSIKYIVIGALLYAAVKEFGIISVIKVIIGAV